VQVQTGNEAGVDGEHGCCADLTDPLPASGARVTNRAHGADVSRPETANPTAGADRDSEGRARSCCLTLAAGIAAAAICADSDLLGRARAAAWSRCSG